VNEAADSAGDEAAVDATAADTSMSEQDDLSTNGALEESADEPEAGDVSVVLEGVEEDEPADEASDVSLDDPAQLMAAVEAILFVRIPQIPSSRAFGTYPVASFDEYMARVPKDRKDWKIVPVDARVFPDQLRDHPVEHSLLSDTAIGVLAVSGLALLLVTPIVIWRKRRRGRRLFGRR